MGRTARIVLPGVAHHCTQRGNKRQAVFFEEQDRRVFLALLRDKSREHGLRILAYCLMTNHVHIVGVPAREESLTRALGETHLKYTAYVKRTYDHDGHLWQNRFYSCPMDEPHTLSALAYVELNPVRAGMETVPWAYRWSSARSHCEEGFADGLLNLSRWRTQFGVEDWKGILRAAVGDDVTEEKIRSHTQRGRPLGSRAYFREKMTRRE